jgi:hypothetical protein
MLFKPKPYLNIVSIFSLQIKKCKTTKTFYNAKHLISTADGGTTFDDDEMFCRQRWKAGLVLWCGETTRLTKVRDLCRTELDEGCLASHYFYCGKNTTCRIINWSVKGCARTKKWSPIDLSVKSLIPSVFTPYPLFQWYPQSKEILLNLSVKC